MGKQGLYAADTAPFYLVFGIAMSIFLVAFMFIVHSYTLDYARIPEGLERYIFIKRFIGTEDCFAFSDDVRVYQGTLDWDKFNDNNKDNVMLRCFNAVYEADSENKVLAFRLTLEVGEDKKIVTTPNWGKNFGMQAAETRNVLVHQEDNLQSGKLTIEVWDV